MPFDWFGFRRPKPSLSNAKPPELQSRLGPLEVIALPPQEAWDVWLRERSSALETGLWPLFLGPDYVEAGRQDPEGSFEELMQEAKGIDIKTWLEQRSTEVLMESEQAKFDPAELSPSGNAATHFTLIDGLDPKKTPLTYFARVPCKEPWMVPLVVPFGGANDCPVDAQHAALFRYWQETYKAELVGATSEIVEFYLPTPIQNPKIATTLAWEMYAYAPDIVEQGTETVEELANNLLGSSSWFFWWD